MKYFTTISELKPFLPDDWKRRSQEEWIDLSKDNAFVPFFRFGTDTSIVWFRKAAIYTRCARKLGKERPDLIDAMKVAGFETAK
jgi:hypothetical protein